MIHIQTDSPLAPATRNQAYSLQFTSTGGVGALTWTIASGAVPAGLTFSSGGLLSGTPTVDGNSTFEVKVTDSLGISAVGEFEIAVDEVLEAAPPLVPASSALTRIDLLPNLPVINGYVSVPDIALNLRVPLKTAFSVIPTATLGRFLGRLFFVLPEFERTNGYPADWYAQLRAIATVF